MKGSLADYSPEHASLVQQAGYKVIRVREHPLPLTGPYDTRAPRAAKPFHVAAAVLQKMIDEDFLPTVVARDAAATYIAASRPVGQDEADRAVNELPESTDPDRSPHSSLLSPNSGIRT